MFKTAQRAFMAAALTLLAPVQSHAGEGLTGETGATGSAAQKMFTSFAQQLEKSELTLSYTADRVLSASLLKGAKGDIDFFSVQPLLVTLMAGQARMYSEIDKAPGYAQNLRAVLGFKAGVYHAVTPQGAGIEDWSDVKDKIVFTGPPAGATAATSEALIKAITGYTAGADYTAVRRSWAQGYAGLEAGTIHLMIRRAEVGSDRIAKLGKSGPFRILSIPDEAQSSGEMAALFSRPGGGVAVFVGGVYENQLTTDTITTLGSYQFIGTHADVPDDVVYKATKAFWDNLDAVQAAALFLRDVRPATAFAGINVPLHPGALRYYDEAGFDVPDALRP